ncbi:tRNA (adenosine(37)-N6)-threonylcarbamoyltransferase complex dimerization subunit type 1 TsaB [Ghiorsea bivora]|uniref:tRNA (adenosine(37)-N6)-threonylcarbamoyltransferase complex dimerization subunit type 1 TsaB n=1 Tax=Ghiorsea bivora TaxID=1485545 RepID=UPI000691E771|nr:tRNA (adenosine(37)-N6)-threonylcarbamoyltransferase complex dimerization subunit type 1 TsaB [Ghiorsea bivora]
MSLFSKPILALDTAAGASVCLFFPDGESVSANMNTPRAHSRELLPLLEQVVQKQGLQWQDIGAFAVGTGPGSFTGLRVACATIAGMNASLHKPVYALSSLAITAQQALVEDELWAIEDARSGLVYAAKFSAGQCIVPPQCLTWEAFLTLPAAQYIALSEITFDLPGWKALPLQQMREQALIAQVRQLQPEMDAKMWVEPLYLQPSQAEKNLV